ncbi:MAG: hypothetical protein D6690_16790 [Nitrospirae bacterium]|nr:MAG: hypothetical protein D6690_16790 [Nitrospirota bacterium]
MFVRFWIGFLLGCVATIGLIACNPEDDLHQYFSELGLNPLAILRTDIEPGALIFVGSNGPVYAGKLQDYTRAPNSLLSDAFDEYEAIIRQYRGDRSLSVNNALKLLKELFQISGETPLSLTNRVHIDMVEAQVQKMKISEIQRFLGTKEARPLIREILGAFDAGEKVFVAYEVYHASRLKITSVHETQIAPSLQIGAIGRIPLKDKTSLIFKKVSEQELLLESEKPYAFAIRAGELVRHPKLPKAVRFKVTNFLKPGYVKAVGTDDRYSAPILNGFIALTLR